MADAFISYSESDQTVAESICVFLARSGYSTWFYHRDFVPGKSHLETTRQEIDACSVVIVLVSRDALRSDFVFPEILHAAATRKPFLPILVDMSHEQLEHEKPRWITAFGFTVSINWNGTQECLLQLVRGVQAIVDSRPHLETEKDAEARRRAESEPRRQEQMIKERTRQEEAARQRIEAERARQGVERKQPARRPGEMLAIPLGEAVEMKFAWIPPGRFIMGSPPGEKGRYEREKQELIWVQKGFYLGLYVVTQAQWTAVMGNDSRNAQGGDFPCKVPWLECRMFFQDLPKMTGKRFSLPLEFEWEYACRAGSTTAYCFGNSATSGGFLGIGATDLLGEYAWHFNLGGKWRRKAMVGKKKPNAWGLYDMHGLVGEWCDEIDDPWGPMGRRGPYADFQICRGYGSHGVAFDCRSAFRMRDDPAMSHGFRVCLRSD